MGLIQGVPSTTIYRTDFGVANLSVHGSIGFFGLNGGLHHYFNHSLATIDAVSLMAVMFTKVIEDYRRSAYEDVRVTDHGECNQRQRRSEPSVSASAVYYGRPYYSFYGRVTLSATIMTSYGEEFFGIFLRVIYWSLEDLYGYMGIRAIYSYASRATRATYSGYRVAVGHVFSFRVIRYLRFHDGVHVYRYVYRPSFVFLLGLRLACLSFPVP